MDIEERLGAANGRCAECGAKLTDDEMRVALESGGGPSLCKIHAAEIPALEPDDPSDAGL